MGLLFKEQLNKLLRLQKRYARVILVSAMLFTKLGWLPFDDIICEISQNR